MALDFAYRFESVFTSAMYADPTLALILDRIGISQAMAANQIALLTDPVTVASLNRAPEGVRSAFLASGWGLRRHEGDEAMNRRMGKDDFLLSSASSIMERAAAGELDPRGLRMAFFDLHRAASALTRGVEIVNGEMQPVLREPFRSEIAASKAENFDLAAALRAIVRDRAAAPRQRAANAA
jgi:hypothetical protein